MGQGEGEALLLGWSREVELKINWCTDGEFQWPKTKMQVLIKQRGRNLTHMMGVGGRRGVEEHTNKTRTKKGSILYNFTIIDVKS